MIKRKIKMKKTLIILLTVIIMGCGGGSNNDSVTLVNLGSFGNEMKYDTTEFTVKAGSKVKLTMKNNASLDFMGEMLHNVVILLDESQASNVVKYAEMNGGTPLASNTILAMTVLADKQEEASVEFTAPKKPGKYLYICTYIAHGATMRGYMIVE
jgi:plastocyanin|tara:strand:+ start:683 stop:1147 length:465 start_codon:yes stop_codon:yes gene_type:complete